MKNHHFFRRSQDSEENRRFSYRNFFPPFAPRAKFRRGATARSSDTHRLQRLADTPHGGEGAAEVVGKCFSIAPDDALDPLLGLGRKGVAAGAKTNASASAPSAASSGTNRHARSHTAEPRPRPRRRSLRRFHARRSMRCSRPARHAPWANPNVRCGES